MIIENVQVSVVADVANSCQLLVTVHLMQVLAAKRNYAPGIELASFAHLG